MKTLNVPGMHCPKCVARIEEAMKKAGVDCEVSLEAKTVSVDETKAAQAVEILDDLGFDAE